MVSLLNLFDPLAVAKFTGINDAYKLIPKPVFEIERAMIRGANVAGEIDRFFFYRIAVAAAAVSEMNDPHIEYTSQDKKGSKHTSIIFIKDYHCSTSSPCLKKKRII